MLTRVVPTVVALLRAKGDAGHAGRSMENSPDCDLLARAVGAVGVASTVSVMRCRIPERYSVGLVKV
jgi:hypothetical protein